MKKAIKKYDKIKYIDEYDKNNDTYCVTTLEIIWLVGFLLSISVVGRVLMLIDILSLGKYRQLHNLNPMFKAASACNGMFPVVCPKTFYAHASDRTFGFLSIFTAYFYDLIIIV